MIGLRESDFNLHDGVADKVTWPVSKWELTPFYKKVATTLGFDNPSFPFKKIKAFHIFDKSLLSDLFDIRISTWIPFTKRNFSHVFGKIRGDRKTSFSFRFYSCEVLTNIVESYKDYASKR